MQKVSIVLEKTLQVVLKYATARMNSSNAVLKQILREKKFPLFPSFTGGHKGAQSSKWLSKPGCGRSVLGTHLDGTDPTAQDPGPCCTDIARWGTRWQKPRDLNSVVGTQAFKAFFQVGLQSSGVHVQPDEQYRPYKPRQTQMRNLCHLLSLACVYGEEPPSLIPKSPDGPATGKAFPGEPKLSAPCAISFRVTSHQRRLPDVALPSSDAGATSAPRCPRPAGSPLLRGVDHVADVHELSPLLRLQRAERRPV